MTREEMLGKARSRAAPWDMVVVGGGAAGVGVAIDAAARGYEVLLLEQADFGKGTSSRSTKLVHGGVRYLEQGNVSLVMEALKERGLLRANAPHLVHDLAFVVPNYDWWEAPFYGLGLKIYNLLAGKYGFGPSRDPLARGDAGAPAHHQDRGPARRRRLLRRPVRRRAAADQPGRRPRPSRARRSSTTRRCTALTKDADGFVDGVAGARRRERRGVPRRGPGRDQRHRPFCDAVRRLADPAAAAAHRAQPGHPPRLRPVRSCRAAPPSWCRTPRDGRVMFAIPWHGHTLVGTTDTPIAEATLEPRALDEEIEFILEHGGRYLHQPPTRADVLSVFVGIRPLVRSGDAQQHRRAVPRPHDPHRPIRAC